MDHQLSPAMIEALRDVLPVRADSIHRHDREPYRWVRFTPRRTVAALHSRGLVGFYQEDYPVGGWRGELTSAGLAARDELRSAARTRQL